MTCLCLLASFGIGFVTYSFLAFLLNITLTAAFSNFYVIIPSVFVVWLSAMIIAKYDLFFHDKVAVNYKSIGCCWEVLFCFVVLTSLLVSSIVSYFAGFNFLTTFLVCYMSFRLLNKLLYNSKIFNDESNYLFKLICILLISILVIMPIFGAKRLFLGMFAKGFVLFNWSDFLNLALSSFSNPLCWLIGLICFLFIANIMISFSYEYMDEVRKYDFLKSFFENHSAAVKFSLFLDEQDKISLNFFDQFLPSQNEKNTFQKGFFKGLYDHDDFYSHFYWLQNFFYGSRVELFKRVANFYGLSYYLARCIKNNNLHVFGNEEVLRQYLTMSKEFKTVDEELSLEGYTTPFWSELCVRFEDFDIVDNKLAGHVKKLNFKNLEQQVESTLAKHDEAFNVLNRYLPEDVSKIIMSYI